MLLLLLWLLLVSLLLLFLLINRQLLLQLLALCCCLFELRLLWLSLCNSSGISCALSLTPSLSFTLPPSLSTREQEEFPQSSKFVFSLQQLQQLCCSCRCYHTHSHIHTHTDTYHACVYVLWYFMYACYNL